MSHFIWKNHRQLSGQVKHNLHLVLGDMSLCLKFLTFFQNKRQSLFKAGIQLPFDEDSFKNLGADGPVVLSHTEYTGSWVSIPACGSFPPLLHPHFWLHPLSCSLIKGIISPKISLKKTVLKSKLNIRFKCKIMEFLNMTKRRLITYIYYRNVDIGITF